MTDRMRVSTICSIRTHMQTRKRPARNCTFLVTGGGLQAERAHYGTSSAAAVTFQPEDRDASDGGHVYEHYGDLAWPCRRFRHGSGASERHSRPYRFWRSAVNQTALTAGLENGTLRPVVGKELPLADAARAHKEILEPGASGKIVLLA